jgi:hypothetical protein
MSSADFVSSRLNDPYGYIYPSENECFYIVDFVPEGIQVADLVSRFHTVYPSAREIVWYDRYTFVSRGDLETTSGIMVRFYEE